MIQGMQNLFRLLLVGVLAGLACSRSDLPFATRQPPPSPTDPLPTAFASATVAVPSPPTLSSPSPAAIATAAPLPSATTAGPIPTATLATEVRLSVEPAPVGYLIPLTVRHVSSSSAALFFELDAPAPGYLLYRPDEPGIGGWYLRELDPGATRHQITLVDLSPGVPYRVQLGLGEHLFDLRTPRLYGSNWGELRFKTPPSDTTDLRIGVLGDTGFGQPETEDLAERMARYRLDFVLHTGDLAYRAFEEDSSPESYAEKFFVNLSPLLLNLPVYPVPGNHEYDGDTYWQDRPFFYTAFTGIDPLGPANQPWYSFAQSGIQFLMLDSQAFHGAGGRQQQTAWLTERLADPGYRFSIPVFHTPPYTSGRHREDGRALRFEWLPLFEAAQVPLVLSGHDHNYERILRNGVTYVVSGGGSTTLYPETEKVEGSQVFVKQTHFVLMEIFSDRISLSAINLDGEVLDQATIPLE